MTLRVEVTIPSSRGSLDVGTLLVRRLEPLRDGAPPDNEVYRYEAQLLERRTGETTVAQINHRYGDGAWVLICNALAALGHAENMSMRS